MKPIIRRLNSRDDLNLPKGVMRMQRLSRAILILIFLFLLMNAIFGCALVPCHPTIALKTPNRLCEMIRAAAITDSFESAGVLCRVEF